MGPLLLHEQRHRHGIPVRLPPHGHEEVGRRASESLPRERLLNRGPGHRGQALRER